MAIIPEYYVNSVVALGIKNADNSMSWIGTGFIVGRPVEDDPTMSSLYIITNKHVVNDYEVITVRLNCSGDVPTKDFDILLFDLNLPCFSKHEKADLVAINIDPSVLKQYNSIFGFIGLNDDTLTMQEMRDTGVVLGTLVYVLGFPMNLVDDEKSPICRMGCVSRLPSSVTEAGFLIDAQTFPGNSGGPVFNRPDTGSIEGTPNNSNCCLIGVVCSYIPYHDRLRSLQTGEIKSVISENSGLSNICPVDFIKEVVEVEFARVSSLLQK